MFFFTTKLENKREKQILPGSRGLGGRVSVGGGATNVYTCMHMLVNVNVIPVETVLEIGGGLMRECSRGGEFKYDLFDTF
jgi:hypothetical protein